MNAIGGMAVGERSEGLGQPVVGVNRAQLAVFDERGDDRPVVAAFVGAGEERVLSVQREVAWRIWNHLEPDAGFLELLEDADLVDLQVKRIAHPCPPGAGGSTGKG